MVFPNAKASAAVMTHEKYNSKGWVFSNNLGFDVQTDFITLADGRVVYCLDERLDSPNGHDLEEMGRMGDAYYRILANGFPNKQPSELGVSTWQEAHYATQIAVWILNTDLSYDDLVFKNENIKNAIDKILNDAKNTSETQDLSFEVTPDAIQAVVANEEFFKAGPFKVNTNGNGTFTPEAINAPEGAYFTDASGNKKTEFEAKEEFYVNFKQVPTGSFNIKVTGNLTKMESIWYKSPVGDVQNTLGMITTKQVPVKDNIKVDWVKEQKGSLELLKVSEDESKLAGAVFELKDSQGNKVATLTTDGNGIAKIGDLKIGTYTLVETKAPVGHELDPKPITVEVKDESVVKVTAKNNLIKNPKIKTTATNKVDGGKELTVSEKVTIQDKVEFTDLIVGKEYVVKGKLMDKTTNKPLVIEGKEVTAETKFIAKEKNGSITLDFTFNAKGLEGKEVVVFEDVLNEGKSVATHADINDVGQTVKFVKPGVKTTATNKADGAKEIHVSKTVTISDKVDYIDLIVGKEYTVKGKLMDKTTGKELLVDGKAVTAEKKFTAKEKNGSITLDFTFNAKNLEGKEVVVFEDVLNEGKSVATHADINDVGQTVKFVKSGVKTTATNKADGGKELTVSEKVTIQDKVEFTDLIVGKEYVVKGKLMDKTTNKPLVIEGKEVTAETKFIAKEKNSSITLDFTFNAKGLEGKEVVVFEDVLNEGKLVATHADINDKGQTVKFKEPKPEQPKPEQPKPEQPKPEQPKPEQPKPEQPKPEQPKPEQPKSEQPKSEPTKVQEKHVIPMTGGSVSTLPIIGGVVLLVAGAFFVLARRNKKVQK
ncbi:TPA: VaFE repeat-containing surface-anchored protein [Bacillus cereus]|nr:VaFE repeat-containing surface-anchored protein [Bacillus cereus]